MNEKGVFVESDLGCVRSLFLFLEAEEG